MQHVAFVLAFGCCQRQADCDDEEDHQQRRGEHGELDDRPRQLEVRPVHVVAPLRQRVWLLAVSCTTGLVSSDQERIVTLKPSEGVEPVALVIGEVGRVVDEHLADLCRETVRAGQLGRDQQFNSELTRHRRCGIAIADGHSCIDRNEVTIAADQHLAGDELTHRQHTVLVEAALLLVRQIEERQRDIVRHRRNDHSLVGDAQRLVHRLR